MVHTHCLQAGKLFNVDGWVCLVTGGGTGIGLMNAQALAANGAKVYITGRRFEVLENAAREHSPNEGKGEIIPCVFFLSFLLRVYNPLPTSDLQPRNQFS